MKRFEYKFNGKVVAIVTVGLNGYATFKVVGDERVTRASESDCKALASAFLIQLRGVTPSPA